jgi:hypothetical protein
VDRVGLLLAVLCLGAGAAAQSQRVAAKIDGAAVWQMPADFVSAAKPACEKTPGDVKCLIDRMEKAGASSHAVAFTRELYKQSKGDFGIMSGYQEQGALAFAWVIYPLRANTNNGLLLVNGKPAMVNLEDLRLLDTKTMERSFQFQDLKNQFPKVTIWPGDRDGKTWPTAEAGRNGGNMFVLSYPLRDGCRACSNAGSAIFTWNFDAAGKFTGTAFQGLIAPPLQ